MRHLGTHRGGYLLLLGFCVQTMKQTDYIEHLGLRAPPKIRTSVFLLKPTMSPSLRTITGRTTTYVCTIYQSSVLPRFSCLFIHEWHHILNSSVTADALQFFLFPRPSVLHDWILLSFLRRTFTAEALWQGFTIFLFLPISSFPFLSLSYSIILSCPTLSVSSFSTQREFKFGFVLGMSIVWPRLDPWGQLSATINQPIDQRESGALKSRKPGAGSKYEHMQAVAGGIGIIST